MRRGRDAERALELRVAELVVLDEEVDVARGVADAAGRGW